MSHAGNRVAAWYQHRHAMPDYTTTDTRREKPLTPEQVALIERQATAFNYHRTKHVGEHRVKHSLFYTTPDGKGHALHWFEST